MHPMNMSAFASAPRLTATLASNLQVSTSDGRIKIIGHEGVEKTTKAADHTGTRHIQFLVNKGAVLRVTEVRGLTGNQRGIAAPGSNPRPAADTQMCLAHHQGGLPVQARLPAAWPGLVQGSSQRPLLPSLRLGTWIATEKQCVPRPPPCRKHQALTQPILDCRLGTSSCSAWQMAPSWRVCPAGIRSQPSPSCTAPPICCWAARVAT